MIVAGLPILPAPLALGMPALLPDSGPARETSAGKTQDGAGDLPAAWLAILLEALPRAGGAGQGPAAGVKEDGAEPEPLLEPGRPSGGEEPATEEAAPAVEPALAAPVVWSAWQPAPAPPAASGESAAEAAAIERAGIAPAAGPAGSSERPAARPSHQPIGVGAQPAHVDSSERSAARPSAGPEARRPDLTPPEQRAENALASQGPRPSLRPLLVEASPGGGPEGELAFRVRVAERPISASVAAPPPVWPGAGLEADQGVGVNRSQKEVAGDPARLQDEGARLESALKLQEAPAGDPARLAAPPKADGEPTAPPALKEEPPQEPGDSAAPRRRELTAAGESAPKAPARRSPRSPGGVAEEPEAHAALRVTRPQAVTPPPAEQGGRRAEAPGRAGEAEARAGERAESPPPATLRPLRGLPEPARRIEVRLQEASEPAVSLHLADRRGRLEVAVRTPDADLAGSLREALPALVRRMEAAGFRAEVWAPEAPSGRQAEIPEAPRTAWGDWPDRREGGRHTGGDSSGDRQPGRERRAALEETDAAPEPGKENERWLAWHWR